MKRGLIIGIMILFLINIVSAQTEPSVCCEQTKSGLFCQDVPQSECKTDARQLPTACESTSYCKPGVCYDSNEGTCMDETPQLVCNANDGIWSENSPAQCELGCCILGDQAAFVTLVRCKKLAGFLGLQTNFNKGIADEVQCVLEASSQEKGACVYDFEFEKTCKFTTRFECSQGVGENTVKGEFFEGKLCSAEELGTKCGPTRETTCAPGKEEVYFVDSCGNAGNIYDSSKINDKDYWSNVKDKLDSCKPNSDNGNSASCGNCNYLLGSYCRGSDKETGNPTYGDNICANLNCENTQNGNSYKHGESWCVFDDEGEVGVGVNSVGSRFYKHICINGDEVLEQCADFRQEECIEDKIETSLGDFSQAACRVNRWQDCTAQTSQIDCQNTDRRDCIWKEDTQLFLKGAAKNGACLPMNPPGLKFWEGQEALNICSRGNAQCVVTFEKGLFGGEKCEKNCECLEDSWERQRADICLSLGDCGPQINWIGDEGYKSGYNITVGKVKSRK
ncbi:MAG: hypothetical protein Q7S27_06980 [Nanoarchaeota archaeon]|nr:hypothetical protein [Nanoarchaeota archaeon]